MSSEVSRTAWDGIPGFTMTPVAGRCPACPPYCRHVRWRTPNGTVLCMCPGCSIKRWKPEVIAMAKAERNGPCPCGSGAKFKKCHGRAA